MKKMNLFKVVMLTMLTVLVLTWIIPASSYDGSVVKGVAITPVPLMNVLTNIFDTIRYFYPIAIFALVVGGFYGVLNATNAYSDLLQKVAKLLKGKEKIFLVSTVVLFALLASFISLPFVLFAFVPMVVSVILILGYDKLTAIAATFGAMMVGVLGSIYGSSVITNINTTLMLEPNDNILTKLVILILGVVLLSFYVIKNSTKVTAKARTEEVDYDPLYVETKKSKANMSAMIVMLGTTFVLFVLGFITWSTSFGIDAFDKFYTWFMDLNLLSFPIMANIFGSLPAFGNWAYQDLSIILILMTLIMALVYKMKLDEYLISFFEGTKKLIPTASLLILIIAVLVLGTSTSTNGAIVGLTPALFDFFGGLTDKFNMILFAIPTMLGSVLNVDPYYYFSQFGLPVAAIVISDPSSHQLVGLMFQILYGFTMLFAPTSVILIAGLSYLQVSYTKWIKYIAMFLLQLFIVIMAILSIVMIAS